MPRTEVLPDRREREDEPKLFPSITGLAVNTALVGIAYFGGIHVNRTYGLFNRESINARAEEFLVKRGVLVPRQLRVEEKRLKMGAERRDVPKSALVMRREAVLGAAQPSPGIPGFLFATYDPTQRAEHFHRYIQVVKKALKIVRTAQSGKLKSDRQASMLQVLAQSIRNLQAEELEFPSGVGGIVQINAERVAEGSGEELNKISGLFTSVVSAASRPSSEAFRSEIQIAQKIVEDMRTYRQAYKLARTPMDIPVAETLEDAEAIAYQMFGTTDPSRVMHNASRDTLHARTIWQKRGVAGAGWVYGQGMYTIMNDIDRAQGQFDRYNAALRLPTGMDSALPNKRLIRNIITRAQNTEWIEGVRYMGIEDVGNGHYVAIIELVGRNVEETGKLMNKVALIKVPLVDQFNRYTTHVGSHMRASFFWLPEHRLSDDPLARVPDEFPLGAQDLISGSERMEHLICARMDAIGRELWQGNADNAEGIAQRSMASALLHDSVVIPGKGNLYNITIGGRVIDAVAHDLMHVNSRKYFRARIEQYIKGTREFQTLQRLRGTGGEINFLDIETVTTRENARRGPVDDPHRRMYQATVMKTRVNPRTGRTEFIGSKTWWIRPDGQATSNDLLHTWVAQTMNPHERDKLLNRPNGAEEWGKRVDARRREMMSRIDSGVDKATFFRQLDEFVGHNSTTVTHFGGGGPGSKGLDIPQILTELNIAHSSGQVSKEITESLKMKFAEANTADSYLMGISAMRGGNTAFALEDLFNMIDPIYRQGLFDKAEEAEIITGGLRGQPSISRKFGEMAKREQRIYREHHSSFADVRWSRAIVDALFLGNDKYVTRSLGDSARNRSLLELYHHRLSGRINVALDSKLDNIRSLYDAIGRRVTPEIVERFSNMGHGQSQAAKLIGNVMDLASLSAWGQFGTKLQRTHKATNPARATDAAIEQLIESDPTLGRAKGSSLVPYFITEQALQFMHTSTIRQQFLGQMFNVQVGMGETPFAGNSSAIWMSPRLSHLAIMHPGGGMFYTTSRLNLPPGARDVELLSTLKGPLTTTAEADLLSMASIGHPLKADHGDYLVFRYKDASGLIQLKAEQFMGTDPAWLSPEHIVVADHNVKMEQTPERALETGLRFMLGTSNLTLQVNNRLSAYRTSTIRSGKINAGRMLDVIIGMDESWIKHQEWGKFGEMMYGKVFGPLLEAHRAAPMGARGERMRNASERVLKQLLGIMNRDPETGQEISFAELRYETLGHLPQSIAHHVNANAQFAYIYHRTLNNDEVRRLMKSHMDWNTIAEMYETLNRMATDIHQSEGIDLFANQTQELYSKPREVEAVQEELDAWIRSLNKKVAEINQELDIMHGQKDMMDLAEQTKRAKGHRSALQHDIEGLKRIQRQMKVGGLKFREFLTVVAGDNAAALPPSINTQKDPTVSKRMKVLGFAYTRSGGFGIYDSRAGGYVSSLRPPEVFGIPGIKDHPLKALPSDTDFADRPSTGIRLRYQALQMMEDGIDESGLGEGAKKFIREQFEKHLARIQYPAVGLGVMDLELAYIGHKMDDAALGRMNLARLKYKDVIHQSGVMNRAMEHVHTTLDKYSLMSVDLTYKVNGHPMVARALSVDVGAGDMNTKLRKAFEHIQANREAMGIPADAEFNMGDLTPGEVINPELGTIEKAVFNDATKAIDNNPNFLFSMDPIIMDLEGMPQRNRIGVDPGYMKELMMRVGKYSAEQADSVIATTQHMWYAGQNHIVLPAMARFHPAVPRGRMNVFSELQMKAVNVFNALSDPALKDKDATAAISHINRTLTEWFFSLSRGYSRHDIVGLSSTAIVPGIRGLAQSAEAAPHMFGSELGPFNLTSKYTQMQTVFITKEKAAEMALPSHLRKLLGSGSAMSDYNAIMSGDKSFMSLVQREPHMAPTSIIPVQTFIVDADTYEKIRRDTSVKTYQIGGAEGVILRVTRDSAKHLEGDYDGDTLSWVFMGSHVKNQGEWKLMEKSFREWRSNMIGDFFQKQHHRIISNIIYAGKRVYERQEVDTWLQRDPAPGLNYGGWRELNEYTFNDYGIGPEDIEALKEYGKFGSAGLASLSSQSTIMGGQTTKDRIEKDIIRTRQLEERTGRITESVWFLQSLERTFQDVATKGLISKEGKEFLSKYPMGGMQDFAKYPGLPEDFVQMLLSARYDTGTFATLRYKGTHKPVPKGSSLFVDNLIEEDPSSRSFGRIMYTLLHDLAIDKSADPEVQNAAFGAIMEAFDPNSPLNMTQRAAKLDAQMNLKGTVKLIGPERSVMLGQFIGALRTLPAEYQRHLNVMHKTFVGSNAPVGAGPWELYVRESEAVGIPPVVGTEWIASEESIRRRAAKEVGAIDADAFRRQRLKPKYLGPASGYKIAGEMLGVTEQEARRYGKYAAMALGVAGLATLFMPGQTEWLIGRSVGEGGEKYDYWGPNYGLPSDVPLDVPEYTFDANVRLGEYSTAFQRKRFQTPIAVLADALTPAVRSLWNQPSAPPIRVDYRDNRKNPITQMKMKRETDRLEAFRR